MRYAALLQHVKILGKRLPIPLEVGRTGALAHVRLAGAGERPGGSVFADDLRSDSLPDFTLRVAVHQQRVIAVSVEIDKARSHHEPRGVNHPPGGRVDQAADGGDPSVFHGNLAFVPRAAAAVDDPPAFDEQVVLRRGILGGGLLRVAGKHQAAGGDGCEGQAQLIGESFAAHEVEPPDIFGCIVPARDRGRGLAL